MEQNTFYNRLSRLFSTDVVIRNKGGNQLKVIDINKIQTANGFRSKSEIDRSQRIYSPKNTSIFGQQQSLQHAYNRPLLYSDYDLMDTHPIIASALDIIADESTLKNDMGEVLQIRSSNDDIQKVLYNLHYDILNIEFNLWSWVRQMCKYGDFFIKLNIAPEYGVINSIPYNAYHIERIEGYDPENPFKVKFKYHEMGITPSTNTYNQAQLKNPSDTEPVFENHEIVHFRLLTDTNFLPYGRSYIEPVRKLYKQLTMMEDAMLIHRIVRAPDRRVFYVNVASIPHNEVENFMQRTISTMKRTPHINPQTGDYDLKYNLTNLLEDYYLPTRGQDASTKVENLPGLTWVGIEDVNYLRDQLFAGLKVPKAFLGYEKDLTGKCLHPDTEIRLLDGTIRTIKQIADEFESNPNVDLYTYSFDFTTNQVVPGKIVLAEKTRLNAKLVKVWVNNDTYVITTPDHGFLLQDGTRVEAQDLKESDSLRTININNLNDLNYIIKVLKVEWLEETIDTYNMEVYDKNENHNYLLANEVVIKNSTLAAEDIRFARTVERIQRIVLSELYKISIIHLYSQGFSKEDITNFELSLTTPSIIYDQERIALLKEKVELAKSIQESKILPEEFIYDQIFHLSSDQIDDMRDMIIEDAKRTFRIKQITEEGNDPKITGKSYGTPHDIASLYGGIDKVNPDKVPSGYDEKNPVGRPTTYSSSTHRVDDRFGKDRLGKIGMRKDNDSSDSIRPQYKGGSPLALESKLITELFNPNTTTENKINYLDEDLLD